MDLQDDLRLLPHLRDYPGGCQPHPRGLHQGTPFLDCRNQEGCREGVCNGRCGGRGLQKLRQQSGPGSGLRELIHNEELTIYN